MARRILWLEKSCDPEKIGGQVWTEGNLRLQILKFLNTEVEKIGDLEKREGNLPKEPEDLTFKITTPSLAKRKYLIAKAEEK